MKPALSTTLAVLAAALAAIGASGASATAGIVSSQYGGALAPLQVVRGHISPEIVRAPLVGLVPPWTRLHLAIGLPIRNSANAQSMVAALSAAPRAGRRTYLTPVEYRSLFSPSAADYAAVIAFARASGLTVTRTYANRLVLDVDATVAAIQQAFHVTMQIRRRPDGSAFYAPSNEPVLALATPILHIAGLDNERLPRPQISSIRRLQSAQPNRGRVVPNIGSGPSGTFAGSDFRNAYATGATQNGMGQCVGLLEFDSSFFPSDIAQYQAAFGLPPIVPQKVLLDGYDGVPVVGTGEQETALDIEVSQAMAPGVPNIVVYAGSIADDIFAAMASGPICNQLSASWNFGVDLTSQQIVDEMVLQGQSLFVSSGDGGGFTSDTFDDRDLSNTAVVGGTDLTLDDRFHWSSEVAWAGSGGGPEKKEYVPTFQRGLKILRFGKAKSRVLPDVAMVASNVFLIADQGTGYTVSGTSISTPLWAGETALINQQAQTVGLPPLGFPDPPLYAIAGTPALYAANFHDITSGSNGPWGAVPGFDMVTGWGSPQAQLISTLNPSPASNFTQLQIVIYTGSDDLRNDSDLQISFNGIKNLDPFCLMRSNYGKPSGACTGNLYGDVNGTQGWASWSTQTLTYTNRFANWTWGGKGTMTLTLANHNQGLETNDNWDIQAMSVVLSNPATSQSVTLFNVGNFSAPHQSGTCYWRLRPVGSPPTIKQTFNLLPNTTPSDGCPDD